jgi:DNA-directed RNA polymerase specialized sigma24 family protein
LIKLIDKLDTYKDKKSSLYTYFYHVIINQITDINRKMRKNRVDYINSPILNSYYKSNDNKLDIEDVKSILPNDEYDVILDKYWGIKCKKMSKRYYNLCLKTGLLRIKNHYL